MRGLPFPQDAVYNREQSHEFGTPGPASTPGLGDISLDPALAGHATAPIFIPNGAGPSVSPQVSLFAILHWWPWWYYVDLLLQF